METTKKVRKLLPTEKWTRRKVSITSECIVTLAKTYLLGRARIKMPRRKKRPGQNRRLFAVEWSILPGRRRRRRYFSAR